MFGQVQVQVLSGGYISYSRRIFPRLWGPSPPCSYLSGVAIFPIYTLSKLNAGLNIYIYFKSIWQYATFVFTSNNMTDQGDVYNGRLLQI